MGRSADRVCGGERGRAGLRANLRGGIAEPFGSSVVVWLAAPPVTASGKLDRGALPAITVMNETDYRDSGRRRAGASAKLAQPAAGRRFRHRRQFLRSRAANLLLPFSLINRCNRAFNADLLLRILFEQRLIEGLAAALRSQRQPHVISRRCLPSSRTASSRRCSASIFGLTVFCYMHLARALAPDQPAYGLQASGLEPENRWRLCQSTTWPRIISQGHPLGATARPLPSARLVIRRPCCSCHCLPLAPGRRDRGVAGAARHLAAAAGRRSTRRPHLDGRACRCSGACRPRHGAGGAIEILPS